MPWYHIDHTTGQPVGPLREEEMFRKWRKGKINHETFVWNGKTVSEWKQIKNVPWLEDLARRHQTFRASGERPRRARDGRNRSSFNSGNFEHLESDHGSQQTTRSFVTGQEIVVKRHDNRPERAVVREVQEEDIMIQFQEGMTTWIYKHDSRIVSPYIDDDEDSDSDSQTPLPSRSESTANKLSPSPNVLSDTDRQSTRSTEYKRQSSGRHTPSRSDEYSLRRHRSRQNGTSRYPGEQVQRAEEQQQEQDLAEKAARLELEKNLFKMEKKQFAIDMDVRTKKYKSQKQMLRLERENFQKEMDAFHRSCAKHSPTELDEAVRDKSRGEFQSVAELDVNLAYLKQQQDSFARQSRQVSKQLRALSDLETKLDHSLQEIHYLYERSVLLTSSLAPLLDDHAKDRSELRTELVQIKRQFQQNMRSHTVHSIEEIGQEWEKIDSEKRTLTRMKSEVAQNVSMITSLNEEHSTLDSIREAVRLARESVEEFETELLDKIQTKLEQQDGYREEVIDIEKKFILLQSQEQDLDDRIRHFEQDKRQFEAEKEKFDADREDAAISESAQSQYNRQDLERLHEKLVAQARDIREEKDQLREDRRRFEQKKTKMDETPSHHPSGSVSGHIFEQLQNRLMDSQARVAELVKETTTAQVELNSVRRENATIREELERLRQELRSTDGDKREAERRIHSLIEEKTRLDAQKQVAETKLNALEAEKMQLEATKQRLESQLAIVQKHSQRLKAQNDQLKEQQSTPAGRSFHAKRSSNMSLSVLEQPPAFNGAPVRRTASQRSSIVSLDSLLLESEASPPPFTDHDSHSTQGELTRGHHGGSSTPLDVAFDSLMSGIIQRRTELKQHEQSIIGQMIALSDAGDEMPGDPNAMTQLRSRSENQLKYFESSGGEAFGDDGTQYSSLSGTVVVHSSSDLGDSVRFDTPSEEAYPRFQSSFSGKGRSSKGDSGELLADSLTPVLTIDLEDEDNSGSDIENHTEVEVVPLPRRRKRKSLYGSGNILHLRDKSSTPPPITTPTDSLGIAKPDTPRNFNSGSNTSLNDLYESPRDQILEENEDLDGGDEEGGSIREVYRKRLVQIYRVKNPSKLQSVENLLDKYVGKEHKLYADICRKYKMVPKRKWNPKSS